MLEDIGELIESYYTLRQSTNEGTMDKARTTVARYPVLGQSVNMPGVSEIYAPLCARLYPETPTNIHMSESIITDTLAEGGGRTSGITIPTTDICAKTRSETTPRTKSQELT